MDKNIINDNMSDNEIRILGSSTEPITGSENANRKWYRTHKKLLMWICAILLVGIVGIVGNWLYSATDTPLPKNTSDNALAADTLSLETFEGRCKRRTFPYRSKRHNNQ